MKLLNTKTNALEYVADPASAIMNGTHAPKKDDTFTYVNQEDGGTYETTGSEIFDRLSKGARLESDAEYHKRLVEKEYGERPVEAALGGAARGLSFGASDALLNFVSPELAEDAAKVREANRGAAIGGEIAGVIIPSLFSGGTSLLGSGAKALTTGTRAVARGSEALAARIVENQIGKRVLGSAIEGAAYGAGQSLSEASLGEPSHLAENLLIGAGFGGAIPLGIEAVKAIGGNPTRKLVSEFLDLTARGKQESFKFLENSTEGKALRNLVYKGDKGLEELKTTATEIAQQNLDLGRESSKFFKQTKLANASEMLAGTELSTARMQAASLLDDGTEIWKLMESRPAIYSSGPTAKLRVALDDLGKQFKKATTSSEIFQVLDETKSVIDKLSKFGQNATTQEIDAITKIKELGTKLRSNLENPEAWGKAATMQQQLNSARSEFFEAEKAFKQQFMTKVGSEHQIDPKKLASFVKRSGDPENATRFEVFTDYIDSSNRLRSALASYGAPTAEGKAAQSALAEQMRGLLASGKNYKDFKKLTGGRLSIPITLGSMPVSIGVSPQSLVRGLGWVERTAVKLNNSWLGSMADAAKSLSKASSKIVPSALGNEYMSYADRKEDLEKITEAAANPEGLVGAVSKAIGPISNFAPETANALQQQTVQAFDFLFQKAPKPPMQPLTGPDKNWKPASSEMARFNRYVTAAQNPMTLLEEIKQGVVSPETAETVKTLYPNFYQKTVQGLAQYIAEKKPDISLSKRRGLSILFDVPMSESMKPQGLLILQSTYLQPSTPPAPKKPMKDLGASMATEGQRLSSKP